MLAFDREQLKQDLTVLASRGVSIGTSSWKYPGWCGALYDPRRYEWKGRLVQKRFEANCLAEYAEVFKSVCVDAAYYKFPDHAYLEKLASKVPDDFLFSFKVTDEVTVKRFSNLPRHGVRAGQLNPNFLNADLFQSGFLTPCEAFRSKIGLLIFEFSRFCPSDYTRGREFMDALNGFLAQLPAGWQYGVEIRNRSFLHPDYFAMLASRSVTHVFNSWSDMPTVSEQLALPGSHTNPTLTAARFLLKPGRAYQQAVDLFGPYAEVKEVNEDARAAGASLIQHSLESSGRERAFIYVNNRLEGNALGTIVGMLRYHQDLLRLPARHI